MSLEEALRENTEALKENTAAHAELAKVAAAAAGKSATSKPTEDKETSVKDDPPKETAAQKKKRLAAEKKAKEAEAAKKAEAEKADEPELATEVSFDDLKKACAELLKDEGKKSDFMGALSHLGAKKLTEVDEEDFPRLAAYVAYFSAGLDVDFENIDEKLAELADGEGGDDPLD